MFAYGLVMHNPVKRLLAAGKSGLERILRNDTNPDSHLVADYLKNISGDRVFTVKTEMTLFFWEHFYSIYEERR